MTHPFHTSIAEALGLAPDAVLEVDGAGAPPAWFAVGALAEASMGAAGLALARAAAPDAPAQARVERRRAALWFASSIAPVGWTRPPTWDPLSGDYRAADGWIRIHANAAAHRAAALRALGVSESAVDAAPLVAGWEADALEAAILAEGGAAATMRGLEDWARHPQGAAVAREPLIAWTAHRTVAPDAAGWPRARPLEGLRVLDLTRVLAGPAATRMLAGYGAQVLRIDPPDWDDAAALAEMTLGKRCAGLDLRRSADRAIFERRLAEADILIHGYRPGALERLGYGDAARRAANPGLIDVALDAYGWTGPWAGRRGFDSLVQMSSGIAAAGMAREGADRPRPLPVQALDHATGYLIAAAALQALAARRRSGAVWSARLSLARTAALLTAAPTVKTGAPLAPDEADWTPDVEATAWGPARRLRWPIELEGAPARWERPAGPLRRAPPDWA